MKKRFLIIALSILVSITACGVVKTVAANGIIGDSSSVVSANVEVSSEYSVLTVKTDWEEMANITITSSGVSIDGSGASYSDGVLTITDGGSYTLSGSSDSLSIVVNSEDNVKLILNGVTLSSTTGPVIYGQQVKNLYIELADGTTNTLSDSSTYETDSTTGEVIGKATISCEDDLIILGLGTLNITGNYDHGIASDDKLYIEDGTINITSTVTDGIHANDLICVDGGTISIDAASDIMESEDMLVINAGTITGTSDDEGLEAKNSLYINGGTIDINVTDDGLNAATYIEINGGTVNIKTSTGDAIDSNGNYEGCITINGGTITANGGSNPEGGIDADNASSIINGGEIIITGDVNSSISESSQQITVILGSFTSGENITIEDESGNTVFSTTPSVSSSTMIVSSSDFESNTTYTVYVDGTESITFTTDSTVVSAGGNASGMGGMGGMDGQMPGMGQDNQNFDGGQAPEGTDGTMPEMGSMGKGGMGGQAPKGQ